MDTSEQIRAIDDSQYLDADGFFAKHAGAALTYGDITLKTQRSSVAPASADPVSQLTEKIALSTPMLSADMDTVTEWDMAIQMALNGGMGMIHSNLTPEAQIKEVARVKHHVHGIIGDPVSVYPSYTIGRVLEMMAEKGYNFSTFPVLDRQGRLQGLLSGASVKDRYKNRKVHELMRPIGELKTMRESDLGDDPIRTADEFFTQHPGVNKLLLVDRDGRLQGLITMSDIDQILQERSSSIQPSRDSDHRLQVGATLHLFQKNGELDRHRILAHVNQLRDAGVDLVAASTAHGHTEWVGEVVAMVREEFPDQDIMAGNVTSAEWVQFLRDKGANIVKVGQGPGSICTTRTQTGVGIPQMTALYVCSQAAKILGDVKILADGGIAQSGDIVKALTMADAVMLGGILAGSDESPGEVFEVDGKRYKTYRWMGSIEAMKAGSAARYGQSSADSGRKLAAEGISAAKEVIGPVADTIQQFRASVQSGMGYLWAPDLAILQANARYTSMTGAGQAESRPHDVMEVKIT